MKVFIAGATGVLGGRLIRDFRGHGHEVVGLSRSEINTRRILALGGTPRPGDLFDIESLTRAAQGCEVIVHAATRIPAKARIHQWDWAENDRIRRAGTRALSQAAGRVGAQLYIQQSVVWVALPADGSLFDETAALSPSLYTASASEGEALAQDAGDHFGFRVAVLRCGSFYAADAAHTRMMGEAALRRRLPIVGAGTAIWANLHSDDASSAFVAAAEAGKDGLWHIVDDTPATAGDFVRELCRLLAAREPRRVPAWLATLFVGPSTTSLFTQSTRTTNARVRRDLAWAPRYPSYRDGLKQVTEAWKVEGFPARG